MTHIATLTLDDTHNPHIVEEKLKDSGRLDTIRYAMVRKATCTMLGEYMRDVTGASTIGPRPTFHYYVTDDDLDAVVSMMQEGLSEYN
jgi:hypothetical protein